MPQNFLPCERDQRFLMPPDMRDWLPEDHLARFLIDAVERLDLTELYGSYRADGWGRAAFDPRMMVTLIHYAFAVGERSTRAIERRCVEDIAFRVITANHAPDHSTIARFMSRHSDALKELFVQVLGLCVAAGLVKVGTVALDGTKVVANASKSKNVTRDKIKKLVEGIFEEAARLNDQEDRAYGERRGDELPDKLADRRSRLEWLDEQLAERERAASERPEKEARGERTPRRKPRPPEERKDSRDAKAKRINRSDPDSRLMKVPGSYMQAFNAQAIVSEDQFVISYGVTNEHDVGQLEPVVTQAIDNLERAGSAPMETVLADAGYLSDGNLEADLGVDLLIAPGKAAKLDKLPAPPEVDPHERRRLELETEVERRAAVIERVVADEITMSQAQTLLGLSTAQTYNVRARYLRDGIEGLRAMLRVPEPKPPGSRTRMRARFQDEDVRATYAKRSTIVEPVFGQIKETQDGRRFLRRGMTQCELEWVLHLTAHNIKKAWRRGSLPTLYRSRKDCAVGFLRRSLRVSSLPRR